MKTIDKFVIGAFILGVGYLTQSYMSECAKTETYVQRVEAGQVTTTKVVMGKCYLME